MKARFGFGVSICKMWPQSLCKACGLCKTWRLGPYSWKAPCRVVFFNPLSVFNPTSLELPACRDLPTRKGGGPRSSHRGRRPGGMKDPLEGGPRLGHLNLGSDCQVQQSFRQMPRQLQHILRASFRDAALLLKLNKLHVLPST